MSPEQLISRLDAALAETRAITPAFHPLMIRQLDFAASVRAAVAPFPAGRCVLLTILSTVDDEFLAGTILFAVAQKLVVNAVKHAEPGTIDVSIRNVAGTAVLDVTDDAVGLDTADAGRVVRAGHPGLAIVRRRVEDAGGALDIATRENAGTRTHATLPLVIDA